MRITERKTEKNKITKQNEMRKKRTTEMERKMISTQRKKKKGIIERNNLKVAK